MRCTPRNGDVVDIVNVHEDDEVLMVTANGKIQRIRARDVSQIGRNTQGVTIIRLDEGDTLVSTARVAQEEVVAAAEAEAKKPRPIASQPQEVVEQEPVEETEEASETDSTANDEE